MRLLNFFRFLATVVVVFGVYFETGPWTAIAIALIAIALELHNQMLKVLMPPSLDKKDDTNTNSTT